MGEYIREWKTTDAADLAKVLSDKRITDNLRDGLPYPYTEKDAEEYINAMLSADKNDVFAFAVIADGRVVGSVSVFRQDNIHRRTAELGYYLAPEWRNRGIMTAAVKEICVRVFSRSDILRVFAETFADNAGSCRVLEKAGFDHEGTMRKSAVKNGVVKDMKMYALIKE